MSAATRRHSAGFGLGLVMMAMVAVLVGLGVWQLQRNGWRNDLVAERNDRIAIAPADANTLGQVDLETIDYRRAQLSGTWDLEHAFIIANRARNATKGEEIVEPLPPDTGGPAVLVNRGWFPEERRDEVLAALRSYPRG